MTDKSALDLLAAYEQPVDLTVIRKKAVDLHEAYLTKADLETRLKQVSSQITKIERDELPEMFTKAGISRLDVDARGNHPPFVAERSTVYTASIPAEKRQDAFQWFESTGHGDLVKSVINIQFGMHEHTERLRVMQVLKDNGVEYYTNESVHHQTLKAFVKREIQAGHAIPNDLLGVYVFDEIKIK